MRPVISKPLFALLLGISVLSLLLLLKPDIDVVSSNDGSLLVMRPEKHLAERTLTSTPWLREATAAPTEASVAQGFVPPPPPAPVMPIVVLPPPPPPKPVAPDPSFSYLGKMIRDDKIYVFLGNGENVEVVALGASVDDSWRVEKVTDAGIELLYLPLNEVRQLAMSDK